MTNVKNVNFRKQASEELLELIERSNIPRKVLEVNDKGHIIIDKNKDPELYDWAVNG